MKATNEKTFIVVSPTRYEVYTSGRKCECGTCHQEAWLSDSSIDAAKGQQVEIICIDCFLKLNLKGEIELQKFTEAQENEIKRFYETWENEG